VGDGTAHVELQLPALMLHTRGEDLVQVTASARSLSRRVAVFSSAHEPSLATPVTIRMLSCDGLAMAVGEVVSTTHGVGFAVRLRASTEPFRRLADAYHATGRMSAQRPPELLEPIVVQLM